MDEPPKKLDLGRAIHRGRAFGSRLAAGANPTFFASGSQVTEAINGLADAEARLQDDSPLWEREWVAMTVRGARLAATGRDEAAAILARCAAIEAKLVAADDRAFASLRARLSEGTYLPEDLRGDLDGRPTLEWDAFVKRLFRIDAAPLPETDKPPGMVHYLPSPMASIFELAALVGPGDVFYDVGSGLGLVTILVAWLSGARAKGVEREPAYHRAAVAHAARFPKLRVEPILGDAREIDYGDATVIYVYDTIRDQLLEELLDRFMKIGRKYALVSRGQSTPQIGRRTWQEAVGTPSGLTLFHSV